YNGGGPATTVAVLKNQGNLMLQMPIDYPSNTRPFSLVMSDVNKDGRMDIAVTNPRDDTRGTFSLLLNQGNGVFPMTEVPSYSCGQGSATIATGDLNGDGRADFAVATLGAAAMN